MANITNKAFVATVTTASSELISNREEVLDLRLKDQELGLDDNSGRRATLGLAGCKFDTHARENARMSGMSAAAIGVFKAMPFDVAQMTKTPEQNGLSREHKQYTFTICECIATGRRPAMLDMSKINEAAKAIDPKFPSKRVGHNTINLLIDVLKSGKKDFTLNYWTESQNGETQGRYLIGYMAACGMGDKSGVKMATKMVINYDSEIVKGLLTIA